LTSDDGDGSIGYTYSDIRTRLLPEALARAFPERKLVDADVIKAAQVIKPTSPMIAN